MKAVAELTDICKYYDLGEVIVKALRGVSFEIPEGDFLAIMGASGSGKSTLLNLLGALDRPTYGDYILGGRNVAEMSDDELSHIRNDQIGFIFQSYNLIAQYTVLENILLPLQYRKGAGAIGSRDVNSCLDLAGRVGLSDRLEHRPFQLSGGQQQRVAIARSLANDPGFILADEPTGNLDTATEGEIIELLGELNREGRTIVMVTHEPQIAKRSKRQIYMQDGLIAGEGIFQG